MKNFYYFVTIYFQIELDFIKLSLENLLKCFPNDIAGIELNDAHNIIYRLGENAKTCILK